VTDDHPYEGPVGAWRIRRRQRRAARTTFLELASLAAEHERSDGAHLLSPCVAFGHGCVNTAAVAPRP